ncbi:Olfactory receptor 14I1 [Fukomys damarensis]|uniref:Olfactory receptor 14I1 n=1 Tax=Fukomys damarensis TaxID=885580 RepID=A0A091DZM3_FUKDA|nr:Olfactory receptor 14I1 [Fukomys damarensis]
MDNLTVFTEFLLMDITGSRELQVLQGVLFLVIYLGALTGNLLTVTVIMTDTRLHSPMYFFISNVALIDLGSISVVVPKAIVNSMTGRKTISLTECAAQIFLYTIFSVVEFALLVVMSYDRYVAICHPLHYGLIITPSLCSQATAGSWASVLVYSAVHTEACAVDRSSGLDLPKLEKCTEWSCERPCCLLCALCTRSSTQAGMSDNGLDRGQLSPEDTWGIYTKFLMPFC